MKNYFNGIIHDITLAHGTDKAFYVDIESGRMGAERNRKLWIPRSICVVGESNENGWHSIMIPQWFFDKNLVDYHRISEIQFGVGGKLITRG